MTTFETIIATILGLWLFWPCLVFGGFVTLIGVVLGGLSAVDAWQAYSDRKRKRAAWVKRFAQKEEK